MTAPARGLLRLAAVAGVRVGHGLLAAAGDLGDDVLLAAARELAENHLLVADRSGDGYAFRHALTREAVYDDLLPGERQGLHRAVAQALTDEPTLGPPAGWAVTEAVAEHWYAAGELEPALAPRSPPANAAREVFAVRRRARPLRAGTGPVGPGDRPRDGGRRGTIGPARTCSRGRQRRRRARPRHPPCRCRHRRPGATPPPRRWRLACCMSVGRWYAAWAARQGELAGVARAGRGAGPARTADPGTRPRAGRARPGSDPRASATTRHPGSRQPSSRQRAGQVHASRRREPHVHWVSVSLMTGTDPEAGIDEFERALAIGREIGDAERSPSGPPTWPTR